MKKKILFGLFLTFLLSLLFIISTSAADADYTFEIQTDVSSAKVGDVVTVSLLIKNNNAESFSVYTMQDYVHYDQEMVSIVSNSVTAASGFKATDQSSRIYVNRYGLTGVAATGDLTVLTFRVKLLKAGEAKFTHSVPEIAGQNIEMFSLETVDASIIVTEPVYGDADGDGKVTPADLVALSRYIAGWDDYDDIDTSVLDLNGDDRINSIDVAILARHIAEWVGYETIPLA